MNKLLLLFAFVFALGCSRTPSWHYTVFIDPKLPDQYVSATYAAFDAWVSVLDGQLEIDYSAFSSCQGNDHEICVHASTEAFIEKQNDGHSELGYTEWSDWSDHADMYIPIDTNAAADPTLLTETISHEAGHSLHAEHLTEGNLMCSNSGCTHTNIPTCSDAAQIEYLRGGYNRWGVWSGNKSCPNGGTFTLSNK